MLARLRGTCPDLSKRELDVLRGVLEGSTTHDIGERFGVKPSSVVTYQKRAYRRLGISDCTLPERARCRQAHCQRK
jgi:DNA-binding CsgD family transcriptional regulator